MTDRALAADERAVTTTLSYVLMLVVTAILVSGLLVAAAGEVEDRRERVVRDELEVVGQQLTSRLQSADRLAETGADEVRLEMTFPASLAGSGYRVSLRDGTPPTVTVTATDVEATETVAAPLRTPVVEGAVVGGDLRVVLTDAGELEVRPA
jgi:hypothetical protein